MPVMRAAYSATSVWYCAITGIPIIRATSKPAIPIGPGVAIWRMSADLVRYEAIGASSGTLHVYSA